MRYCGRGEHRKLPKLDRKRPCGRKPVWYGRLSWDTSLSANEIAVEWIMQTYCCDARTIKKIVGILVSSWITYEKYTSPLGIGWMVNPGHHYGPNVDGYEYDRWGTYHRADSEAIGVDRSDKGTGYAMQYFELNADMYNHMDLCPENLLLFFHRVRYDHVLKTGKTLIQHIYDMHFEGIEDVRAMIADWVSIQGTIDDELYRRTLVLLKGQLEHAMLWRDVVNTYFYRKTGNRGRTPPEYLRITCTDCAMQIVCGDTFRNLMKADGDERKATDEPTRMEKTGKSDTP